MPLKLSAPLSIVSYSSSHICLSQWSVSEDGSEEDKIHQQKLRVTYLAPEGETLEEEDESQIANASAITIADNSVSLQP